jgi:hypothetical protein
MRRFRTVLLGFLVAAPVVASAALTTPGAGEHLRPGSWVTARRGEEHVPPQGDEMELLLSLDGGRTYTIRITPENGIGEGSLSFRVPNLPTREARLALRAGEDGRDEQVVAESAVFLIEPSSTAPLEELERFEGELGTREARAGRPGDSLPGTRVGGEETFDTQAAEPDAAEAPAPFIAAPLRHDRPLLATSGAPTLHVLRLVLPRAPLDRPKRE